MSTNQNNQPAEPMGRPPIHDAPMSAAERQRRRRQRLRKEPWNDPRLLAWAVVSAVRSLRAEEQGVFGRGDIAALIERATQEIAPEADQAEQVVAALERFLDPEQPLPQRGHRGRRGSRGHRFGHRHRRRDSVRRADDAE